MGSGREAVGWQERAEGGFRRGGGLPKGASHPDTLDARRSRVQRKTPAQTAFNVGRWHRQRLTFQRCFKVVFGNMTWVKACFKAKVRIGTGLGGFG